MNSLATLADDLTRAREARVIVSEADEVSANTTKLFESLQHSYDEALALNPSKDFYTKVGSVVETLNADYKRSELDTSRLDSQELKQAFDESPECR